MTNGWPCWRDRCRLTAIGLITLAAAVWLGHWWATMPRTPQALFQVRCASCHELRSQRVCEFDLELRPAIVDTMRRLHGADAVIDDVEAEQIAAFLADPALCADTTATALQAQPEDRRSRVDQTSGNNQQRIEE